MYFKGVVPNQTCNQNIYLTVVTVVEIGRKT